MSMLLLFFLRCAAIDFPQCLQKILQCFWKILQCLWIFAHQSPNFLAKCQQFSVYVSASCRDILEIPSWQEEHLQRVNNWKKALWLCHSPCKPYLRTNSENVDMKPAFVAGACVIGSAEIPDKVAVFGVGKCCCFRHTCALLSCFSRSFFRHWHLLFLCSS